MRIGYACKCEQVPGTKQSTCTAARATEEKLMALIDHNLTALNHIFDYNSQNGLTMFRISSDIIPFGSSPVNALDWPQIFGERLQSLGAKAMKADIRLSMHPGQYTVLNSPNPDVVERAILDLDYHRTFLDALGLSREHKLILHIGGVYGNKVQAIERFCDQYEKLSGDIKKRLVVENDERNYNIAEVLEIGQRMSIPVVFDNLHHDLNPPNPPDEQKSASEWVKICSYTWQESDGLQKMHYSQQAEGKRNGAHSETINPLLLKEFIDGLTVEDIDIMLEVKDKNISALKCIEFLELDCARSGEYDGNGGEYFR